MSWYVNKTQFLDNLLISFSPFPKKKQEQKKEDNPPKVPIDDNDDNDDDHEFEFEGDEEDEQEGEKKVCENPLYDEDILGEPEHEDKHESIELPPHIIRMISHNLPLELQYILTPRDYKGIGNDGTLKIFQNGRYQQWDDGVLEIDCTYNKDRQLHGTYRYFLCDVMMEHMEYHNGLLHGMVIRFYHDGRVESVYMYFHGFANGLCQQWHPNGRRESEDTYMNGKNHGRSRYWNDVGQITSDIYYVKNSPRKCLKWYDDGKPMEDYKHDDRGMLHGDHRKWDKEGNLTTVTYDHGNIVHDC